MLGKSPPYSLFYVIDLLHKLLIFFYGLLTYQFFHSPIFFLCWCFSNHFLVVWSMFYRRFLEEEFHLFSVLSSHIFFIILELLKSFCGCLKCVEVCCLGDSLSNNSSWVFVCLWLWYTSRTVWLNVKSLTHIFSAWYLFLKNFIYFCLWRVLVAVWTFLWLQRVGAALELWCTGLLLWLVLWQSTGSRTHGLQWLGQVGWVVVPGL